MIFKIDMRSLVFSFIIMDVIITIVMIILWLENRERFRGTLYWTMNFVLQTIAVILIALRGFIPDWASMVVSNTFVLIGTLLGIIALERLLGIRRRHFINFALIALFAIIHFWFTYGNNNLEFRNLNLSVFLTIISVQYCILVFFGNEAPNRKFAYGIAYVFAGYCIVNVLRIIDFFTRDHINNDYMNGEAFDVFVFIAYQVLFVFLTFSIYVLYNRKLMAQVEYEKDKFFTAFHSAPYGLIITKADDGEIMDVNESFERISQFTKNEVLGKTTLGLKLWVDPSERVKHFEKVNSYGKVVEAETDLRRSDGVIINCLLSTEVLPLPEGRFVLSSILDISERKKNERLLNEKVSDLEKMNRIMIGRELRMAELKKEINTLCVEFGLTKPYDE